MGLVPPRTFFLIIRSSLRAPRRRGPSFCIDRKKAKSDQGCALDPDGQRRRSLRFGPTNAAQSAWTGALPGAMIDVCLGGSMLGWAAGCGVGWIQLPLSPDIARFLLKVGLIGCLRRIWIPCGGKERAGGPLPTLPPQRPRRPEGPEGQYPPQGTSNSSAGIRGSGAFAPAFFKRSFASFLARQKGRVPRTHER